MGNYLINLNFLGIVKISGKDNVFFLHNLLSNDIKNLKNYHACYATFNNNKGRIIANLLVIKQQEDILLILSKDLIDYFIQKIKIFILRSTVNIQNFSNQYEIIGILPTLQNNHNLNLNQLQFPTKFDQSNNLIKILLPHAGKILINQINYDNKKNNLLDENIWKSYEINLGIPWINLSSSEKFIPQMLNLQNLGAINFKKGCYPGQEIIARTQYLGKIKRGPVVCESKFKINDGEIIFDKNQNEIGILVNSCKEKNYFKYLTVIKLPIIENKFYNKNIESVTIKKFLIK